MILRKKNGTFTKVESLKIPIPHKTSPNPMAYQSGCWIFGNVIVWTPPPTSQCNVLAIFQAQTTRDVGEL